MVLTAEKKKTLEVFTMENHDNAYYVWKNSGLKQKILIHIDAHHDIWFIQKDSQITIANFICKALEEDIVKEVYWVVPDKTWETKKTRNHVLKHLKIITKRYPGGPTPINIRDEEISTTILGEKLRVCTLDNLPYMNEEILLDIDVDFMVIPQVSYGSFDTHSNLPWCWPGELLERLRKKNIFSNLITVAYSVEGGYTPLKWKYLGDELACRLNNSSESSLRGMELIKEAAILAYRGDINTSEKMYQEAKQFLKDSPVVDYHLAFLHRDNNDLDKARICYQEAISKDPSYKTPYNSLATRYFEEKNYKMAEKELHSILELDPCDAYAHYGLGFIAFKKNMWGSAEKFLKRSIELNKNLVDSYRTLGDLRTAQKQYEEAISFYEQFLKLSLSGYKSLHAFILTCTSENLLTDPEHYSVHSKLARLYTKKGLYNEAISGYRISIAGGHYSFFIFSQLAFLYLRIGKFKKTFNEIFQALKTIPSDLIDYFDDLKKKLKL